MASRNSFLGNMGNIAQSTSMYGTKNGKRPSKRKRIGNFSKLEVNFDVDPNASQKRMKTNALFESDGGEPLYPITNLEKSSLENSNYQANKVNISVDLVGSTVNVLEGDLYESISDEEMNFSQNLLSQISNEPLIIFDDEDAKGNDGTMTVEELIQPPSLPSINLICSQQHDREDSGQFTKCQRECEPPGAVKDQVELQNFGQNLNLNKKKGTKRTVIIDGSNVAFNHSGQQKFSVEGIAICINYFVKQGYDVKAIVPKMRQKWHMSSNPKLLSELEKQKKVVFSPCKNLPDNKYVSSYDDRMILDVAHRIDAVVISNDDFRDIREEREEYMTIVKSRVIGFLFFNDEFVIAPDPYGKNGPSAEDILMRRHE